MRSLIATTSIPRRSVMTRNTLLPILPKPLMAILIVMTSSLLRLNRVSACASAQLGEAADQLDHASRVSPAVVIPGERLQEVPADHLRREAVEDRRMRIADHVGGDDRLLGVLDDRPVFRRSSA